MTNDPFLMVIPVEATHDPEMAKFRSPISIEHTLIQCPRCNRDCWIGPKQKLMHALAGHDILCMNCVVADPTINLNAVVTANLGIEDVPRRVGQ